MCFFYQKTIPPSYTYSGCALPNISDSFFELDLEINDASISPPKGSDDDDDDDDDDGDDDLRYLI